MAADDAVAVHAKLVPATFDNRVTLAEDDPVQMVCAMDAFVTFGSGFTVTIWLAAVPLHPAKDGVTEYVTSPCVDNVLLMVCEGIDAMEPDAVYPVIPAPEGVAVHAKVVPATADDIVTPVVEVPLQIDWVGRLRFASGTGLTLSTKSEGMPGHPLAEGVMVYVTVPGAFVEFTICWFIVAALPDEYPDIPGVLFAIHEYVEPATLELSAWLKKTPEHCEAVSGLFVITVVG